MFECDCKAKWLFSWLKMTNSTVSDVVCVGPPEYQGKKLNDVTSFDSECITTDFVVHQILTYQSVSVDTFQYKNDVFVAIAQPSMENCMILEWDHIEMNFRSYDNITGQSIVGCKAILIDDQVFMVVAQLFGGSLTYTSMMKAGPSSPSFKTLKSPVFPNPMILNFFKLKVKHFLLLLTAQRLV
ncbi:unnamed protein product [Staurois parvus]|uniref:LRRCT domain-containing protein n=1 Tax=Staurois parvus TaxID=386267 RepID=A0ABN9C2E2_9NEOB|nr:unnamed protein product [Staurois parvus]